MRNLSKLLLFASIAVLLRLFPRTFVSQNGNDIFKVSRYIAAALVMCMGGCDVCFVVCVFHVLRVCCVYGVSVVCVVCVLPVCGVVCVLPVYVLCAYVVCVVCVCGVYCV